MLSLLIATLRIGIKSILSYNYSAQLFLRSSCGESEYLEEKNRILKKRRLYVYLGVSFIITMFHVQFFVFMSTTCKRNEAIDDR